MALNRLRDERGIGLAEMMVTLGVVLSVLALTTQLMMESGRAYTNGQAAMEARNNSAAGVDMMERLIRQSTALVADPDANGIFDSIRVVADWNPRDGAVTGPYETVTFSAVNGVLQMQDSTMAAPVAFVEGVDQLRFTYADHRGAPLPAATVTGTPALIGMVAVSVRAPAIDGRPQTVSTINVALRRVK